LLFGDSVVDLDDDGSNNNLEDLFDFVLFVMPSSITSFMATAITNRYDSYYTQDYILRPSFQIHEIGHNLGLKHAGDMDLNKNGKDGSLYGDQVGYMGYGYFDFDGPSMCFNVANNYKLNWYAEQTYTYNPIIDEVRDGRATTTKEFILNGVNDYDDTTNTAVQQQQQDDDEPERLVVLRLLQTNLDNDFYIGYNSAKGINKETFENKNKIVIIEKMGSPESTIETQKRSVLKNVGDYYAITNYNYQNNNIGAQRQRQLSQIGQGKQLSEDKQITTTTVYILFQSLSTDKKDATIVISTTEPIPETSASPTASPTTEDFTFENVEVVQDDREFGYNNDPLKNCYAWIQNISKGNEKRTRRAQLKRCNKKWDGETKNGDKIKKNWCPVTCQNIKDRSI